MEKRKILFVAPMQGNGGITSWAANYRKNIGDRFELVSIGVSKRRSMHVDAKLPQRIVEGMLDMLDVLADLRRAIMANPDARVMHLATGGGLMGCVRDYCIGRIANRHGLRTIMHCHFGCLSSDLQTKGLLQIMMRATLRLFDQIWVLDRKSVQTLENERNLKAEVVLAPNFLNVPDTCDIGNKSYKNVAFVGNLFPEKGIYELVEAVASMHNDTTLTIIGPGLPHVVSRIRELSGAKLDKEIKLLGRVSNDEAIRIIGQMDIIALPTYYPYEAFPISILEAMSRGKMVISCPRAAIPDMLTDLNGNLCGRLVEAYSPEAIADAVRWCQENSSQADEMCREAFRKVSTAYRTDVVLDQYAQSYDKLYKR